MNDAEQSLPELLRERAEKYARITAIKFAGSEITFQQLNKQSDQLATGLVKQNVKPGDRVALYCPNSIVFAVSYIGILKCGATVVPINLLLNPKEIAYILDDAKVTTLIYHHAFAENVAVFRPQVASLANVIGIDTDNDDLPLAQLIDVDNPPALQIDRKNDVAVIIYTSGTTGHPKGAMLTHHNLISNTESIVPAMKIEPEKDVVLLVLPMFHAFAATVGMLTPLLNGLTIVPLPKFDPPAVANAIEEHQVTIFLGVPSMYNVLLRLPETDTQKIARLRFCISGGAAMPVELIRRFEEKFGVFIYEGDGPTECSPVTSVNPIGGTRKVGSIGLPVPNVEMKIMDEQGNELPLNEIGEICVRGPNVMKGYLNRPEETAESFFADWFRTGDLGSEDEEHYFYIVDRKKDMVIVNGMNVYPRVIEEVLYKHESIIEVAVVGEPSERHGEIPVVHVVLAEGKTLSSKDVKDFCKDHLGSHEVPRKVFFLDQLPRNAAGKILKRALRKTGEIERGIDSREG
jgi:long-chain acyl-CoA synthetase